MPLRALVEAVDLELEAVVAQLEQQLLEQPGSRVREAPAAKVGVDGQPAEIGDPAASVRDLETHHPGGAPLALLADLDHEAAEVLRLGLRPLDLGEQARAAARADDG